MPRRPPFMRREEMRSRRRGPGTGAERGRVPGELVAFVLLAAAILWVPRPG